MRISRRDRAERLARQLQGIGPTSHDPKTRAMIAVAQGLAPAEPLSETTRSRTKSLALRELRRASAPVEPQAEAGSRDGLDTLAPHTARVTTAEGVQIVMADLEHISEDRAAEIAKKAAALVARMAAAEEHS